MKPSHPTTVAAVLAHLPAICGVALAWGIFLPLDDKTLPWWAGLPGGFLLGVFAVPFALAYSLFVIPCLMLLHHGLGRIPALAFAAVATALPLAGTADNIMFALIAWPYATIYAITFCGLALFRKQPQ